MTISAVRYFLTTYLKYNPFIEKFHEFAAIVSKEILLLE